MGKNFTEAFTKAFPRIGSAAVAVAGFFGVALPMLRDEIRLFLTQRHSREMQENAQEHDRAMAILQGNNQASIAETTSVTGLSSNNSGSTPDVSSDNSDDSTHDLSNSSYDPGSNSRSAVSQALSTIIAQNHEVQSLITQVLNNPGNIRLQAELESRIEEELASLAEERNQPSSADSISDGRLLPCPFEESDFSFLGSLLYFIYTLF